ncbi:hypothetical protein [Nocardiopsis sp. CNT312]|uniref:hypothetical protein n=1 Tax=Nocardiopsis sp. CNT312 TaxID=1137268 RepID=UPI00048B2E44|nr:hypothetical protein [Nocardiopsis sp. CNT312]
MARGNEHAFAQVYELAAPSVYGPARRIPGGPARSDEVAQEILGVWRTVSHHGARGGEGLRGLRTAPRGAPPVRTR